MLPGTSPLLDFFIDTYRTPPFLLPIYLAAAERYAVPWQVLAAINEVESDYGYDLGVSSAGAEGWMQFLPEEWSAYGVDANGAGVRDPYNPADAIFAAARYLQAAGAAHNLRGAIYAYNHSSGYVESVLLRARLLGKTPQSIIGGLAAIVDGRMPVQSASVFAATPAWTTTPRRAAARSVRAGLEHSAGTPAVPPPPAAATASATGASGATVVGANIEVAPGTPVVAVQNAEVIRIGRSTKLGRFIELRDAYGDVYTYARLGRVLKRYKLPPQPRPTGSATAPNGQAARSTGMRLERLREGTWVAPGIVLGNVTDRSHGSRARFLFEVRPAGAGPIDPRPLLEAWRSAGPDAGSPPAGHSAALRPERPQRADRRDPVDEQAPTEGPPAIRAGAAQDDLCAGGHSDPRQPISGLARQTGGRPAQLKRRAVRPGAGQRAVAKADRSHIAAAPTARAAASDQRRCG